MSTDGLTEERLKAALDAAADAVVVTDAAGSIVAFNRAAELLAGTSAAEVLGLPLLPFAAERGATGAELAILRAAFRDGKVGHYESAALSGSLDLEATLSTLGDLVVPAWADVCAIALCEPDGHLRRASLHHADPVAARLAERWFPPRGTPLLGGRLEAVLEGGPRLVLERFELEDLAHLEEGRRAGIRDARVRSVIVVALRVRSEPVGVLCIATTATSGRRLGETHGALFSDVAARAAQAIDNAHLYQAVRTAEGRFRAAFDHAPIGIALVRLDAEGHLRYAEANPALCGITGYEREALVGRPIEDFTHPDDRAEERRRMNWLVERRVDEVSGEKRHVRADGEMRWLQMRAAPFERGAFVVQIQDVTERRRVQDELEHLAITEIRNAGIDPTRLIFEVTETAAIGNVDRARVLARRLTELGCGFALDDFGAGFGSFAYLKHLPLDVIKIDGEFVRHLPDSHHDQITVRAIVDIARGLGKETVAEFVEDADTVALLRRLGVDRAQGFHVGRPRLAVVRPDFEPYAASGPSMRGEASATPSRPRRLTS